MSDDGQIFRRMILSDAGMVFIEGYIQAVMQAILNAPMVSHGMRKCLHVFQ